MTVLQQEALVSMGANLPMDRAVRIAALRTARDRIARDLADPGTMKSSAIYATQAYPAGIGADFVNACLAFTTTRGASDCLAALHRIEADAGRTRSTRWGERALDLDLLGLGAQVLPDVITQTKWRDLPLSDQRTRTPTDLILPHPRLQDRAFVLVPLADVAPDWTHPVTGASVTDMHAALPPGARAGIDRIGPL